MAGSVVGVGELDSVEGREAHGPSLFTVRTTTRLRRRIGAAAATTTSLEDIAVALQRLCPRDVPDSGRATSPGGGESPALAFAVHHALSREMGELGEPGSVSGPTRV